MRRAISIEDRNEYRAQDGGTGKLRSEHIGAADEVPVLHQDVCGGSSLWWFPAVFDPEKILPVITNTFLHIQDVSLRSRKFLS